MSASQVAPNWLKKPADLNAINKQIWPQTALRSQTGALEIGGTSVIELASEFGTPLYVIDQSDFESKAASFKSSFDQAFKKIGTTAKIYYAGKAFLCTEIVRWVDALGLNIDVASGGELAVALAAGIDPARIGLHGNNKSLIEIGRAVSNKVGAIVIDSEIEIERIAAAAASQGLVQPVRLRVNCGVHASTHEYLATASEDQKFGVAMNDVDALVAKIRSHSSLKFLGLHSHIGSQIHAIDGFIEATKRLLEIHARLSAIAPVPELNLGGGFGIAYVQGDEPLPFDAIATAIAQTVEAKCKELGITVPALAFEPGRALIGQAGITVYKVGTIKDVVLSDHDEQVRKYVSVDGGMSDNMRTALYEARYSASLASRASVAPAAISRLVGKHCESGDIVVRDSYLPQDIAPNDLLAVAATGAYCFSLANNYNYLARPAVVAVKQGSAKLIVRGETEQDLLSRDTGVNSKEVL